MPSQFAVSRSMSKGCEIDTSLRLSPVNFGCPDARAYRQRAAV